MKLLLFLDDTFLDGRDGVVRRFLQPRPVAFPAGKRLGLSTIIHDEKRMCYRLWHGDLVGDGGDGRFRLFESDDGLHWRSSRKSMPAVSPKQNMYEQTWFYDRYEQNPEYRHKMTVWPYKENTYGGPGLIATSPDGVRWTNHPEFAWSPADGNGSDTSNHIFFNPFSREWCVICRRYHADRRLAMVTSKDLRNWTPGRIILQPDPLDPPLMQLYGSHTVLYEEEYFIGLAHCYHTPAKLMDYAGGGPRLQMFGFIEPQLIWSFDGQLWNRSDRTPFIRREEPGHMLYGCVYPRAMVPSPNGKELYIYSRCSYTNHGTFRTARLPPEIRKHHGHTALHVLRKDGFACLEPDGGRGEILTKSIIPTGADLAVNYLAPYGEVRVEVADERGRPLEGYTFDDCVPLSGDALEGRPRWKRRRSLAGLKGKSVRLRLRLVDARVFAVRLSCTLDHFVVKAGTQVSRP